MNSGGDSKGGEKVEVLQEFSDVRGEARNRRRSYTTC